MPNSEAAIQRDLSKWIATARLGLGTASPQRLLQIGPSTDAMFTIDQSDGSPRAGFIRFGDKTGWNLVIGRSRESAGGPLNTGFTGNLFAIRDDGAIFRTSYPLGATGVEHLCRTLSNAITRCQASSLRYKTAIAPYAGGLDVVEKLKPIAFTRKESGTHEVGFGAEDIAAVEPRLAYNNDDGAIEGVHYELLTTVLVNAVKQQQEEIKQLATDRGPAVASGAPGAVGIRIVALDWRLRAPPGLCRARRMVRKP